MLVALSLWPGGLRSVLPGGCCRCGCLKQRDAIRLPDCDGVLGDLLGGNFYDIAAVALMDGRDKKRTKRIRNLDHGIC